MVFFRPLLSLDRRIHFVRSLGTGQEGHFSGRADLRRWAIFAVWKDAPDSADSTPDRFHRSLFGRIITGWWRIAHARPRTWVLVPVGGHGSWSGQDAREWMHPDDDPDAPLAVLTRATVKWRSMKPFHALAGRMGRSPLDAPGCIMALGIGEWPFRLQATISIWKDEASMKAYAYSDTLHMEAVRRTRKEGWYKEELFLRARVVAFVGSD